MKRCWQVSWTESAAYQMHRRLSTLQSSPGSDTEPTNSVNGWGGKGGSSESGKDWREPRRCLVDAVRFIRRHEGTLLLKARGAGLAEVRVIDIYIFFNLTFLQLLLARLVSFF